MDHSKCNYPIGLRIWFSQGQELLQILNEWIGYLHPSLVKNCLGWNSPFYNANRSRYSRLIELKMNDRLMIRLPGYLWIFPAASVQPPEWTG
jgi:hypothetical protein